MCEDDRIDVFEHPRANEISLGPQQLLRNAGPQHQRSLQMLTLHDFFKCKRRREVQSLPAVMPLTVPWSALNDRVVVSDAGLLRGLRNAVDIGPECNHGLSAAPSSGPRSWNTSDAPLN